VRENPAIRAKGDGGNVVNKTFEPSSRRASYTPYHALAMLLGGPERTVLVIFLEL